MALRRAPDLERRRIGRKAWRHTPSGRSHDQLRNDQATSGWNSGGCLAAATWWFTGFTRVCRAGGQLAAATLENVADMTHVGQRRARPLRPLGQHAHLAFGLHHSTSLVHRTALWPAHDA